MIKHYIFSVWFEYEKTPLEQDNRIYLLLYWSWTSNYFKKVSRLQSNRRVLLQLRVIIIQLQNYFL
jgi:hypothetical protein